MNKGTRLTLSERFWPKVDRRGDDECWLWLGAQTGMPNDTHKYGTLRATPASTEGPYVPPKRAHVASWELHHGRPVPNGMVVCHTCDVPLCVNPRHLFAATQRDNTIDRSMKDRNADRRGEQNPNRKLSPEQVAEIRARYRAGETQTSLAKEFGVIQPHVSRIVRGEAWSGEIHQRPSPGFRFASNGTRSLSAEQVARIRRRYAEGETQMKLAAEFGVSQGWVSLLVRRD
jgi:transposase-like protein